MDPTLAWLLRSEEPAVRLRVLTDLEGRRDDDPEVREARTELARRGWAKRLLDGMPTAETDLELYVPKYGAPFHRAVVLAELGVPASEPRMGALLERLLEAFSKPEGGFGSARPGAVSHLCITGNLTRTLLRAGLGEDPRVQRALDWLVDQQLPDGGWHCWPEAEGEGTLDAWEALGAFEAVPPGRRDARMRKAIGRGVGFLLARGLGVHDDHEPWRRFHHPTHYYYDALVGLDLATALGDPKDPRLAPALALLRSKRGADGLWRLDAVHPDVAPGSDYAPHRPGFALPVEPLALEKPGEPSAWVSLAALRVLRRAGGA